MFLFLKHFFMQSFGGVNNFFFYEEENMKYFRSDLQQECFVFKQYFSAGAFLV